MTRGLKPFPFPTPGHRPGWLFMSPDPPDDLRILLDRLRGYLRDHPDARQAVSVVGRALAALADWSAPAEAAALHPPEPAPPAAPAAPAAPEPPPFVTVAEPPPIDIRPVPPVEPPKPIEPPKPVERPAGEITPRPLPVLAERCRLKADACRLVARRLTDPAARSPAAAADLIARANRLPDCYLWMLEPDEYSDRPAVWAAAAEAFAAAAAAADMLAAWLALPDDAARRYGGDVLHLAAEAQAVLFAAVLDADKPKPDIDQVHLFVTIREEAAARQEYVHRYLRRDDPADPATVPDVARRVGELTATLRRLGESSKARRKALANLRYKAPRLLDDPATAAGEWPRVVEILDELVAGGLPPSNAEVRDLLLPVADALPDGVELTRNAALVFREIDRYLAGRPAAGPGAPERAPPTAEVAEVRRLLAGRRVVLIGGLVRPDQRTGLIDAFDLADLDWVGTVEHESVTVFEAPIARPEVAVVLLAIRWSSHSYGDVRDYCERYGKLLVRLPGGYHPNQVAHQILSQVGHRLRAAG